MRRAVAALAVVSLLAYAACTLIDRPDSYYDPAGTLVTLAIVPGGASALALTRDDVYFVGNDNSTIYRVPKAGGDTEVVSASTGGDIIALASDGQNRVAWCTSSGGISAWLGDLGTSQSSDGSIGCELVAISPDRIAFVSSVDASDEAGTGRFLLSKRDDGGYQGIAVSPTVGALAFDDRDTLYFAGSYLQRETTPADGLDADTCFLSPLQQVTQEMFVGATDAGPMVFLAGAGAARVTTQHDCCVAGKPCPEPGGGVPADLTRDAVRGSELYRVQAAELVHEPLAVVAADGGFAGAAVVRAGLPVVAHLVVDDRYAFFASGDAILRLALGDGGS